MEVITKFFVLALCFAATSADVNEIPPRCIENSVTAVSCNVPLGDDRLLPHPDDCQLFYYCVNTDQQPICRECPAGLHFNPTKKVCDFPANAGCKVGAQASYNLSNRDIDSICENPGPNWPRLQLAACCELLDFFGNKHSMEYSPRLDDNLSR